METKVILCDECKQTVAKYKCDLCGKDVCDNEGTTCFHNRDLSFCGSTIIEYKLCETCDTKVFTKVKSKELEKGKLSIFFLDLLRKNCMIETLMKGGKND